MGAALAAFAGLMFFLYYGVTDFFVGFLAGIKAFTAAVLGGIGSIPGAMLGGLIIGLDRDHVVGLFHRRVQGRGSLHDAGHRADLPAARPARQAGSGEGLIMPLPKTQHPAETPLSAMTGRPSSTTCSAPPSSPCLFWSRSFRYKSIINQGSLSLTTRWPLALGLMLLVVVGRPLLCISSCGTGRRPSTPSLMPGFVPDSAAIGKYVGLPCRSLCCHPAFRSRRRPSRHRLAIYILTYIMLAWGLNIVVGLAGLLDLGYVAFYAVGAYAYALLSTIYFPLLVRRRHRALGILHHVAAGRPLPPLWGVILGFPVLRLRGDYLAIVTLAFGEIIRLVLINWFAFTNGPQGINVPKATFFGLPFKAARAASPISSASSTTASTTTSSSTT